MIHVFIKQVHDDVSIPIVLEGPEANLDSWYEAWLISKIGPRPSSLEYSFHEQPRKWREYNDKAKALKLADFIAHMKHNGFRERKFDTFSICGFIGE